MKIEVRHEAAFDSCWDLEGVRQALGGAKHIVLVAHQNADGDAVGSLLGMWHLLKAIGGRTVTPMLPDGVPDDLDWLPGVDAVISGDDSRSADIIAAADLVVYLDLSTVDRTGRLADRLRASTAPRLHIDHHEKCDVNTQRSPLISVVEPEVSSTCELVYWLMSRAFGDSIFTREAATCLYTGICTDTGTFSYSNERPSLYLAAADLLRFGIDPMDINRQIKNVFTEERLRFFGHAMDNLLTVYPGQQVALMVITAQDMKAYGVESADLTGLINEVMKLRSIDCGILVREESDRVRLSLRSKVRYDVNQIARDLFDGGGHKRAAGATSHLSLSETVAIVKQKMRLAQ